MPRDGEYPHNVTPLDKEGLVVRRLQYSESFSRGDHDLIDPNTLGDTDFAHHRLTKWGHPISIGHVTSVINNEVSRSRVSYINKSLIAPSLVRLNSLLTDPRYEDLSIPDDPHEQNFIEAFLRVKSEEQATALQAVQRLHQVSISSELSDTGPNPHVKDIVLAILYPPEPPKKPFLRGLPGFKRPPAS